MIKKYNTFLESKKDIWNIIPKSIKDINNIFKLNGKELYLVGGCIRDFLNNEKPKDFDLCTNATPDEIIKIIDNKYRVTEQGKSFGVVVVYTKDQPMGIEIATFREDVYNDKLGITRNPDIKFSTIEKDVLRRDIPFNSMFYDLNSKKIIDLVGGMDDIKNKITRFVGNPDDRIMEDPLRILRLLRFSTRYNFKISDITKESILNNKNMLSIISKERIWDEMKKAFSQSKNYNTYLNFFTEFNMWGDVFPGSKINTNLVETNDFIVIIANLFRNEKPSVKTVWLNISLYDKMVQNYKIEIEVATKVIFLLLLNNFNVDNVFDLYKKKQQCGITNETIEEWLRVNNIKDENVYRFINYKPSVSAQDLMDKGFKGKELGEEIKRLEILNFKNEI